LRARQIISAIGIQHRAKVVNLENKVVYHPARRFYSPIAQQAADEELTVPYISLKRRLGTTYLFAR
jgi:hypothetical protein